MRPKPQLSQQQTVDTKVVMRMALFLSLAREAMAPRTLLQTLADAMAEPRTRTRAICMEKDSSPQKPLSLPQASTRAIGVCCVPIMAPINTTMVRMMANRNGSGSHRLTTRTQPLVNFLNMRFSLLTKLIVNESQHNLFTITDYIIYEKYSLSTEGRKTRG